jgi:hypothetical protein
VEQKEINDITMEGKDHNTISQQQQQQLQQQNDPTSGRITTALAAGNFTHQFNSNTSSKDKTNYSTPSGVKRQ